MGGKFLETGSGVCVTNGNQRAEGKVYRSKIYSIVIGEKDFVPLLERDCSSGGMLAFLKQERACSSSGALRSTPGGATERANR